MIVDDRYFEVKIAAIITLLGILFLVVLIALTSGCLTYAKQTAYAAIAPPATPTQEPTAAPTPTPNITINATPAPIIYDWGACDPLQECYYLREFKTYFRQNANNFGEDLRTSITVYDYKLMPYGYHYYSVSWARPFKVAPPDGKQFLFVFVNMWSDETTKARQYIFNQDHFVLQIRDNTYAPDDVEYPERRITEFDDMQNYARTGQPWPWGYKIIQEMGSGIYRAEYQPTLYTGRSNAADGWIRYTIPNTDKDPTEMRIHGNLANLGGRVNWVLQKQK